MSDYDYHQSMVERAAQRERDRTVLMTQARSQYNAARVKYERDMRLYRRTFKVVAIAAICAVVWALSGCDGDCQNPFEKPDCSVDNTCKQG